MKKKGFTLIELLAVIVILAIIALIATPIVMNVIENSRKGAAERSAENYMDAVEIAIASERLEGPVADGEYSIDSDGNLTGNGLEEPLKIEMNGKKPSSGKILIENGQVVTSSQTTMKIGDYTVSYDAEGKIVATKVSPSTEPICTIVRQNEDSYTIGDEITCTLGEEEDKFYIIEDATSTATSVYALTEYALDLTTHKQSATAGTITYSAEAYWCDEEGKLKSEYSTGDVYDRNSNLYPIIEGYVSYLKSNGLNEITGGLITSAQRSNLMQNTSEFFKIDGKYGEFWADGGECYGLSPNPDNPNYTYTTAVKTFVFFDVDNGLLGAGSSYGQGLNPDIYTFVVRPVITFSTSELQ